MYSITTAQRRARLGVRHRLAAPHRTDDVADIVRSVVVLHATDPATVYLSAATRGAGLGTAHVEHALYEQRSLLRMLAMRRTMFVAPVELEPVLHAACGAALAVEQRRTYVRQLDQAGIGDGDARGWLDAVVEDAHRALLARGSATAAQLSQDVPALRTQIDTSPGKSYSRPTTITSWVMLLLGVEGRIVRGRPNGSWTSSQYTWVPRDTWLPTPVDGLDTGRARTELVRHWLRAFGPAPIGDLKWWTGWTLGQVRTALTALDTVEVDLDGTTGILLADDLEPVPTPAPWAALLPALDPTPMGWQSRDWYLGEHKNQLFDRNGNIGPSIWYDGRIVGGWAQRKDGEIVTRLLEDIGADAEALVRAETERAAGWFGELRPVPRFRTPLERELTG